MSRDGYGYGLRATGYGLFGVKRWKCTNACIKVRAAKVIAPVRCSTLAASICLIDGVGNTKTALAPKCVIAMGGTFWRRSPGEDAQATFWQAESNGSGAWRLACIGLPFAFCRAPSLTPSVHRKGKTGASHCIAARSPTKTRCRCCPHAPPL